ncbi:MAG: SAM-dependent methyltransferase [Akkermansiaceae bacterium]|jgi:SAM-dependent MidA family methyltransferase|nr:SAM-dependent methyltransferase [Akkermansiaceae bacterium]
MLEPGIHGFREIIARALYDPGIGYYSSNIGTVGRTGDFSTSATLGAALGTAISRWAYEQTKASGIRNLIEIGAGDGSLAQTVLKQWPGWRKPQYHIVDSSPRLRTRQKEKLGNRARWHADMAAALAACDGRAILFANELVDAFPPEVLLWDGTAWQECCLEVRNDGIIRETIRTWQRGVDAAGFVEPKAWPGGTIPAGQRVEHLSAFARWMNPWISQWRAGSGLWLDYGDSFPALYHRRPEGTLRAYWKHERLSGPDVFRRLGKQDITCDVNFSDLAAWCTAGGFVCQPPENQSDFIRRYQASAGGDDAGMRAGENFRVLGFAPARPSL